MKYSSIFLSILILTASCTGRDTYYTVTGMAQGGEYHITFCDVTQNGKRLAHEKVTSAADSILTIVDMTLSGYNKQSMLSKFNNSPTGMEVNSEFMNLFTICHKLWKETDGLFDVAAAPYFDYWGFGFRDPKKMEQMRAGADVAADLDSIRAFAGMTHIQSMRAYGGKLVLQKDDFRSKLNFNAIAQGYTCDLIAAAFDRMGIHSYLIDVGMEIRCKGKNAKGANWRIGIDAPIDGNMTAGANIQDVIEVTDCGVVTSGNYRKFFVDSNGEKFAHSINPKTGYPARDSLLSATVIAPDAATADAYATYCMVLGYEKAAEFLASRDNLRGYLIAPHTTYRKLQTISADSDVK